MTTQRYKGYTIRVSGDPGNYHLSIIRPDETAVETITAYLTVTDVIQHAADLIDLDIQTEEYKYLTKKIKCYQTLTKRKMHGS